MFIRTLYVGIDVGKDGGIAVWEPEADQLRLYPMPKDSTPCTIKDLFVRTVEEAFDGSSLSVAMIAGVEDVHSIFGAGAKSNFQFGRIKGIKEALCEVFFDGHSLIQPKAWQKLVHEEGDIVYKEGTNRKDPKATSLNAALRIWPDVDFRKSERAKKPHDGLVDAALIAKAMELLQE